MSSFKVQIRRATAADIDALIALEHECFQTDRILRRNYLRLLKKITAEIFVAVVDQQIVGNIIIFYRRNSKTSRVYSLAVQKIFRKFGVAHNLLKSAVESAVKRGCNQLILEVNDKNADAWHNLGLCYFKMHDAKDGIAAWENVK